MRVVICTLFPEMFSGVLQASILRRAQDAGALTVELVNFREFARDRHKTVDDYPFGGGAGMLLKPEPLFEAVDYIRERWPVAPGQARRVVLLSPLGRPFTQRVAEEYAALPEVVLLCGHYEGFDERVRQYLADDELSFGDVVFTGGEIPAMAFLDAVARLLPGVLGNDVSAADESFAGGLLE
ncbi:MAG: tRNA (guanosine(37)-N1)-methyltransferase TrmD, partial [Alicyclobacillus sp.]|nr:tRNA (guanosine(37)-N1)-methyltransferase TrmD [Alicyclobacillus sp.]